MATKIYELRQNGKGWRTDQQVFTVSLNDATYTVVADDGDKAIAAARKLDARVAKSVWKEWDEPLPQFIKSRAYLQELSAEYVGHLLITDPKRIKIRKDPAAPKKRKSRSIRAVKQVVKKRKMSKATRAKISAGVKRAKVHVPPPVQPLPESIIAVS